MTQERAHPSRPAKRTLPRWLEGYDLGEALRRHPAKQGTIVAFKPVMA